MGPVDDIALHALMRPSALAARDLTHDRRWTYAELDLAVARCASLLRGIYRCETGDRVAVLAKNRVEHVILQHACAREGLIFVPLNWRLSQSEIVQLLLDAEPRVLIGDAELNRVGIEGASLDTFIKEIDLADPSPPRAIDPEGVSLILFTSGTTGKPKGVMLSERALFRTAINFGRLGEVTAGSTILIDLPMFHVIGLVTCVRPVLRQGGVILVSEGFAPTTTLARLADPTLGVTHYFCVPQMADRLLAEPGFEGSNLKGLTGLFTGGAPLPQEAVWTWLGAGVQIINGYGMSEAGTVFGMPVDAEIIKNRASSVGVAAPGAMTRLVNAECEDVGAGQPGELLLKGENLFAGYWRAPHATTAAFTTDGWFRTGDIAVRDTGGFFRIVDRKKDMFISGGENVYPAEIESLLNGFPGLIEAAVVGVTDEQWGEVGLCALVASGHAAGLIDAVRTHLEAALAPYKRPRHYVVLGSLPRTGSGKVRKFELKTHMQLE